MNNHQSDQVPQSGSEPQVANPTVADLSRLVEELPSEARERFERLFQVSVYTGGLRVPQEM